MGIKKKARRNKRAKTKNQSSSRAVREKSQRSHSLKSLFCRFRDDDNDLLDIFFLPFSIDEEVVREEHHRRRRFEEEKEDDAGAVGVDVDDAIENNEETVQMTLENLKLAREEEYKRARAEIFGNEGDEGEGEREKVLSLDENDLSKKKVSDDGAGEGKNMQDEEETKKEASDTTTTTSTTTNDNNNNNNININNTKAIS